MSGVDPGVTVVGGVLLMLLIAAAAIVVNRQPRRLRVVDERVDTLDAKVGDVVHALNNVRQVVPAKVDELFGRMAKVEGELHGLAEIMKRVERSQEAMLNSQLRREGDGR